MDLIDRQAAIKTLEKGLPSEPLKSKYTEGITAGFGLAITWIEQLPAVQPCDDAVSRQQAIDAIGKKSDEIYKTKQKGATYPHDDFFQGMAYAENVVKQLPSTQPQTEWNSHTVACLLAELFGDACACNYNGIDEWLPEKCEVIDACPNPVGVACWEQFLKHRAERRTDE